MSAITGFEPVCGPGCRVLILGSMPSVRSLELGQYYGHPRNAFWPIMCELLEGRHIPDYARRTRMLIDHGIALWDVCHCCERETSSDARIRNEVPNDIAALAARLGIERVLLNGGAAAALYRRHVRLELPSARLPSTSPAYTLRYEAKRDMWRAALTNAGVPLAPAPADARG